MHQSQPSRAALRTPTMSITCRARLHLSQEDQGMGVPVKGRACSAPPDVRLHGPAFRPAFHLKEAPPCPGSPLALLLGCLMHGPSVAYLFPHTFLL